MSVATHSPACMIYTTTPDQETARTIGRALVEEHLAACANIRGEGTSIYLWEGVLRQDPETVLILKTTVACSQRAIERIVSLHPYETPCVLMWEIDAGHDAFTDWIRAQVQKAHER